MVKSTRLAMPPHIAALASEIIALARAPKPLAPGRVDPEWHDLVDAARAIQKKYRIQAIGFAP